VVDSGAGIDAKNISKVFQDIVQFDVNKNQKGGGSGMGLWLSKQIVELHGGTVAVTSEGLGKGCCFELRLSVIAPSPSFCSSAMPGHSSAQLQSFHRHAISRSTHPFAVHPFPLTSSMPAPSRQCLVVDDSKLNRKVMVRLLGLFDCPALEAGDGMQCVTMVRESVDRFGMVFIDNEMPLLSGPEAVAQLRAMGYRGSIVGVTGNAQSEELKLFSDCGADEVLLKPVTLDMLGACLGRHGLTADNDNTHRDLE
jgi:CheY-like chemotaxis protein